MCINKINTLKRVEKRRLIRLVFVFYLLSPSHPYCQTDSLSENVTLQMSHPGIIIQTVTSEDLPDPLNQTELAEEQDLANEEEPAESPDHSKQEGESNEPSSKAITDKVLQMNTSFQ